MGNIQVTPDFEQTFLKVMGRTEAEPDFDRERDTSRMSELSHITLPELLDGYSETGTSPSTRRSCSVLLRSLSRSPRKRRSTNIAENCPRSPSAEKRSIKRSVSPMGRNSLSPSPTGRKRFSLSPMGRHSSTPTKRTQLEMERTPSPLQLEMERTPSTPIGRTRLDHPQSPKDKRSNSLASRRSESLKNRRRSSSQTRPSVVIYSPMEIEEAFVLDITLEQSNNEDKSSNETETKTKIETNSETNSETKIETNSETKTETKNETKNETQRDPLRKIVNVLDDKYKRNKIYKTPLFKARSGSEFEFIGKHWKEIFTKEWYKKEWWHPEKKSI